MFGIRPDGRRVGKDVDAIVRFTPYVMRRRSDSQVFTTQYIDADILSNYINEKRKQGIVMNHMAIIIAAYLRTVSEFPELNRFVVGTQLFARNELTVSFVTVKAKSREDFTETSVKAYFDPRDTVFDVAEKVERIIEKNRKLTEKNATDVVVNALLSMPALTSFLVSILMGLDQLGLMPKAIVDASPFHTSLFISNMASIKMNSIYHHIYDFGTTSVFLGVGKRTVQIKTNSDGQIKLKKVYPIGCVIDERIMAGAQYGIALSVMNNYLTHPEKLETPPEKVLNEGVDFSLKEKYRDRF